MAGATAAGVALGAPRLFAQQGLPGQAAPACVLTPQQGEGPYYLDTGLVRRDITEGRPGTTLQLAITVLRAGACTALSGALVEVWHTDAAGSYSGFSGQPGGTTRAQTYMRGVQPTDASGTAVFDTIYPGWYPGRTVHIHFTVHLSNRRVITSQLYFPDAISDAVHAAPPYNSRPNRRTRNANDGVLRGASAQHLTLTLTPQAAGYRGGITVGVA